MVSVRARRKVSACALPRPSATASAKLANRTVNQSQAAICPVKDATPSCAMRSRTKNSVTRTETTSVTKMTGFFASDRGSSLCTAAIAAGPMILRSNSPWGFAFFDMDQNSRQKVLPPSIR